MRRLTTGLRRVSRFSLPVFWGPTIIVASLFYLVVCTHVPINVQPWAAHDDGLFISLGQNLAEGNWLGKFNEYTLMKGPGYPLFLAANAWSGLPISFSHALFFCLAVGLFSFVVMKISRLRLCATALFLITLWHPFVFFDPRVVRDAIYPGQVLLILTGLSYVLFIAEHPAQRFFWGAFTGLLLGWFWLTREEGVWVVPGLGMLVLFAGIRAWRTGKAGRTVLVPTAVILILFAVSQFAFQLSNRIAYGDFVGVDFKEKHFTSAMAALQSVRAGEPRPYVPVPRAVRKRIYDISPTFATLEHYLDPPSGPTPWQNGCSLYPSTCGDIAGGWFMWALRNGATTGGHYRSPAQASAFFRDIAGEVNRACRDGRLDCKSQWIPYMPRVTTAQLKTVPKKIAEALSMLSFRDGRHLPDSRTSDDAELLLMPALSFLNHPLHVPPLSMNPRPAAPKKFFGWYYEKGDAWFNLNVVTENNTSANVSFERKFSGDISDHFRDKKANWQRFIIQTGGEANHRMMISDQSGKASVTIHMGPLLNTLAENRGFGIKVGNGTFFIDPVGHRRLAEPERRIYNAAEISGNLASGYGAVFPFFLVVGALSFLTGLTLAWKKRQCPVMMALAATAWVLIATRMAILILIDITAFPAINLLYFAPLYPLASVAAILSFTVFLSLVRGTEKVTR